MLYVYKGSLLVRITFSYSFFSLLAHSLSFARSFLLVRNVCRCEHEDNSCLRQRSIHSNVFAESFLRCIHVKMALELLKYMRTCTKKKSEERKRDEYKQSSLLFFSIPFSRNSSLVYTHTHIYRCSINGYNISHAHTHARTYIIKRKKKKKKQS